MIGIFDSGIGGLTVVRALMKTLPGLRLLYFGDTARTPYGTKSPETIVAYAIEDTEFLLSQGAQIIVIACNSAASVATDILKERYPEVPIFEVISPAVKKTVAVTQKKIVGVIGTRATIESGIYERKIKELDPTIRVFGQPCPLLVPLVEEGWLKRPETKRIVRKYLQPLKVRGVDTLVLGCTHYPLLKPIISAKMGRRTTVIDSSEEVAREIGEFLKQRPDVAARLERGPDHLFYVSDLTPTSQRIARLFLTERIQLLKAETMGYLPLLKGTLGVK
ncbi:glutamate racemase [Thermosulfuriphilus ammonigenes]|uniref:Glutamate racemase n=1 Tax=Thermosulfuriphilus ammonigenes TaxID=1936021 RepID=A0A6G7PXB4_9BACT|nr:glutamate racemase [Thermosulfuriphilus ammonigenes]MBA2849676.1 glutamate racemase [Thermosulfuriphilus ammonigenes]QIJ72227.1 glutamate racemase [Thermosulfuriphilus ammonigenes]HFB83723.1 glutamate racemase [Thermodesulfatator sp.]